MENAELLRAELIRDEGMILEPYQDIHGYLTIGVGRNLDANGITEEEALILLDHDIDAATLAVDRVYKGWRTWTQARQRAIVNMMFNMGPTGLSKFKRMNAAIARQDWNLAADEAEDSLWFTQVGPRAERVVFMLRYGRAPTTGD